MTTQRRADWVSRHPSIVDAALFAIAAALLGPPTVLLIIDSSVAEGWKVATLAAIVVLHLVPLTRRRLPAATYIAASVAMALLAFAPHFPYQGSVAPAIMLPSVLLYFLALYEMCAYRQRWYADAAVGIAVLGAAFVVIKLSTDDAWMTESAAVTASWPVLAAVAFGGVATSWGLGRLRRTREDYQRGLEAQAASEERRRIETELGRFQSARERIGGWVERATGEGRLMLAGHLLGTWVIIDLWAGQIDEARELGERLVNGISFVPDLDPGTAALIRCNIAIHSGHWPEAVEHGQAACAFHDSPNSQGLRRGALASLALALAASGQHTQASQVAHEAELARVGSNQVVEAFSRIYLLLAGMWIRQPGVAAEAAEAVDWACRNQLLLPELWLRCAQSVIDPGTITRSVQDRVAELVRQVDAPIAGPLAEHINAVATEDPSQVDLGRRALARLGLWLPPGGRSGVLTAREREIAHLASLGYTSKAIAVRLVLSPRTVETHLRHAFTKLDISSRDELPSALGELER